MAHRLHTADAAADTRGEPVLKLQADTPPGLREYAAFGDNTGNSLDSRYWGLLERWRLEGRAVFTYFSYNRDSYRPFPAIREIRWSRILRGIH